MNTKQKDRVVVTVIWFITVALLYLVIIKLKIFHK